MYGVGCKATTPYRPRWRITSCFSTRKTRLILVTGHRRESFDGGFERVCQALLITAKRFPDCEIVYPVHMNPNVRKPVNSLLTDIDNIYLIDPLDYLTFVYLMNRAYIVLTDSGGIQEEAPSLGKPVLVMRETTERPEAVAAGTVKLMGTDINTIVLALAELLTTDAAYQSMSIVHNPYGDGRACQRIIDALIEREAPGSAQPCLSTTVIEPTRMS